MIEPEEDTIPPLPLADVHSPSKDPAYSLVFDFSEPVPMPPSKSKNPLRPTDADSLSVHRTGTKAQKRNPKAHDTGGNAQRHPAINGAS